MAADLFDQTLRRARRDRAARTGPELFLLDRAFTDCLERLTLVQRAFRSALLIGCPDPAWRTRLLQQVSDVTIVEPGAAFATMADAEPTTEEEWSAAPSSFDLCIAVGTLDTVNDLPAVLRMIHSSLRSDGLLLGALAGGDSLPKLRAAMHAADQVMGAAAPRVHPRIDPPTLAALLAASGFAMPVIDVDRVSVSYSSFRKLVSDLRGMGATNVLRSRSSRPLNRAALCAAGASFASANGLTIETIEILHFAGWVPVQAGANET